MISQISETTLLSSLTLLAMAEQHSTDLDSIERLTRRMVRQEEDAYREFYRHYGHRLFRYLLVVTHGQEDIAKDALQQTLLRVVRNIRLFESEEVFWSWLTVLCRSAATDQARKGQSYLKLLKRFFEQQIPESHESSSGGSERLDDHMDASLASLNEEDRQLIQLKYTERIAVRDIAEQLSSTEKAIESRLVRVRQRLKASILERLHHETKS